MFGLTGQCCKNQVIARTPVKVRKEPSKQNAQCGGWHASYKAEWAVLAECFCGTVCSAVQGLCVHVRKSSHGGGLKGKLVRILLQEAPPPVLNERPPSCEQHHLHHSSSQPLSDEHFSSKKWHSSTTVMQNKNKNCIVRQNTVQSAASLTNLSPVCFYSQRCACPYWAERGDAGWYGGGRFTVSLLSFVGQPVVTGGSANRTTQDRKDTSVRKSVLIKIISE